MCDVKCEGKRLVWKRDQKKKFWIYSDSGRVAGTDSLVRDLPDGVESDDAGGGGVGDDRPSLQMDGGVKTTG